MWELLEIAALVFILNRVYQWRQSTRPENKIEELEERADYLKKAALEDHLKLGKEIQLYVLEATERDYLYLKERYKHDMQKRLELAMDWRDYTDAIHDLSSASELLDVDMEETAWDTFEERIKEPHIKRQEIERRFQELLGNKFADRWSEYNQKYPSPII